MSIILEAFHRQVLLLASSSNSNNLPKQQLLELERCFKISNTLQHECKARLLQGLVPWL